MNRATTIKQNKWIPIKEFLKEIDRPMRHVYYRTEKRDWYDGFVIKKGHYGRYEYGCLEDYKKWNNLV
ncbi:MAG: hypothetical protein QG673_1220 [Pseudomonadota bacterium]|nr:hypothetical protein [Pseudomonadota bacterium]